MATATRPGLRGKCPSIFLSIGFDALVPRGLMPHTPTLNMLLTPLQPLAAEQSQDQLSQCASLSSDRCIQGAPVCTSKTGQPAVPARTESQIPAFTRAERHKLRTKLLRRLQKHVYKKYQKIQELEKLLAQCCSMEFAKIYHFI